MPALRDRLALPATNPQLALRSRFQRQDVSQLLVIGLCPEVGIGLRVNQLHIDPHLIGRFLHATLKNVRYSKLLRDLGEIARFALITLVEVREITFKSAILASRVRISSCMPSAK